MPQALSRKRRTGLVKELVGRFEGLYGQIPREPPRDPVDELICCILSQHTTDVVSFPAFDDLKSAFPTWNDVVEAGCDDVARIIRRVGLAKQKARTIVGCLIEIEKRNGAYTLDPLRKMLPLDARAWLTSLKGVGPKTASIVLSFALEMPVVAVDTHVHRLSSRLGLLPSGMNADRAHDELLSVVPPDLAFRFHRVLILHGRSVCRSVGPRCGECAVSELCQSGVAETQKRRKSPRTT